MARMRRRFADRSEAAKANVDRFGKGRSGFARDVSPMGRDLTSGIMNPNLRRRAVDNNAKPPWWETQVGGKAYGPFHKSGTVSEAPEDYPGLMKLEPGQNYSYMDLAGNKMLNQSEWTDYNPYRRSNPLIQDLSEMAGSQVPDEYLFTGIGDGNFKWDPWKSEELINARHWLPEEYSINPGISQTDDVFRFRKFPWMAGGGIASLSYAR